MNIWTVCGSQLERNISVALMVIVETKGSSPGKVGFKMAVSANGELNGSIGGGSAEYEAVEMARAHLKSGNAEVLLKKQVHNDKDEDSSGMICSGQQSFVIIPLEKNHLDLIKELEINAKLLRRGNIEITPNSINYYHNQKTLSEPVINFNSELWQYKEPVGLIDAVYIFGGGHVSVELSRVLEMLGFYVLVFDNRDDISTMKMNVYAHHKEIIDFKNAGGYVPDGDNNYVVIMTVGHMHDLRVLEQMVSKHIKYLGMMGSSSKVVTINRLLNEKGFSEAQISRVYMPIGEPIRSHMPIEIAISISAQIIKIKNTPTFI